jgi:hypothetical protein
MLVLNFQKLPLSIFDLMLELSWVNHAFSMGSAVFCTTKGGSVAAEGGAA